MVPEFRTVFRVPLVDSCGPDSRVNLSLNGRWLNSSLTLLVSLSPKLSAMYNTTSSVTVEKEVAGEMTTLLSTGQVDVNAQNIELLARVAHQHDIPSLHIFCERLYLNHLSPGRCLKLWLLAMDRGLQMRTLQKQALKLVLEHFESISQTESFCHLGKHQVEMLILDPLITNMECGYKAIHHWSQYPSEQDLRAEAKEDLSNAFNQKLYRINRSIVSNRSTVSTEALYQNMNDYDISCHLPLSNESSPYVSLNRFLLEETSVQCPGSCRERTNRRVSESHSNPATLWVAKKNSSKLDVVEICLENGNVSPYWHAVSFPSKMEEISAFWYCARRNCMFASNDKDTWRLDDGRHAWKRCSKVPSGRRHHMMCGAGKKLYAIGGYDYQSLHLTEYVLEYDMDRDHWTEYSHAGKLQERVESGKCVAIGTDIYIFGGRHSDEQGNLVETSTAQRYDAENQTSEKLADLPFRSSNRDIVSCAVTDNDYIYIFSSSGEVVRYNPHSDEHQCLPPYPIPRNQFGAFIADQILYIFGGQNRSNTVLEIHCLDLSEPNSDWQVCGMLDTAMTIVSNS